MRYIDPYYDEDKSHIAVLVSHGYGAGWSTWNDSNLAYDRRVVEYWLQHSDNKVWMEEASRTLFDRETVAHKELREYLEGLGYSHLYLGGWADIILEWVPTGTPFLIDEYDGAESLRLQNDYNWEVFY